MKCLRIVNSVIDYTARKVCTYNGLRVYTDTHQNAAMFGLGVLMYHVYGEIENYWAAADRFSYCQIVT